MPRFSASLLVLYIVDGLKDDLIICFNVLKLFCDVNIHAALNKYPSRTTYLSLILRLTVIRYKELQKWKTKTVVVLITVNRASAISVLWVQLKAVCSASWCRLVLIRGKKQKLIIFIHT